MPALPLGVLSFSLYEEKEEASYVQARMARGTSYDSYGGASVAEEPVYGSRNPHSKSKQPRSICF